MKIPEDKMDQIIAMNYEPNKKTKRLGTILIEKVDNFE